MFKIKYVIMILMALTLFVACQPRKNGIPNMETNQPKEFVKGELIVVFKNEATYKTAIKELEKQKGVQFINMLMTSPPDAIIGHFKVPEGKEKEMITVFQKHPEVKYAELNALGSFGKLSNSNLPILTVTNIENGKDGYTAHLEDGKNGKYTMVVSIPNLGDKYVDLKVGDKIQAEGEYAERYPVQIFAKSIRVVKSTEDNEDDFVRGKVVSIENGKDGYTAKIKTEDGKVYYVTISIPNLGRENAHQYRDVSVGEIIEVKGELWSMGDEQRITVRAMNPAGE